MSTEQLAVTTESAPVETVEQAASVESAPAVENDESVVLAEPAVTEQAAPEEEFIPSPKTAREIANIRKRAQEAERKAAYLEGMLHAAKGGQNPQQELQNTEPQPPKISDFETYDEYEAAKDQYREWKIAARIRQELYLAEQNKRIEQTEAEFMSRLNAAAETDPEVMEYATSQDVRISPAMAEIIKTDEYGIEILKWLGTHKADARRIAAMTPAAAGRELGKLAVQFSVKPEVKKVSYAPQPIKTITPTGTQTVDDADLPMSEFVKRRNQALFKR